MSLGGLPDASTLLSLAVAVSFAAGLNVYATALTLGLAGRFGWLPLPSGLHALTSPWMIAAAAVLFAAEFVADKIPGFDVLWNAAHTLIRVPLAALLAFGATTHLTPELQAVATVLGGALAMLAHTSKTAARVLVTPSPEPVSNIALSTAEDVGAIGLTSLATLHPLGAAGVVGVLGVGAVVMIWFAWTVLRRLARRTWERIAGTTAGATAS